MPRQHAIEAAFIAAAGADDDANNRRLVWRVASQIRLQRGVPEGEVVRVTLHDKDGTVLFEGNVR